MAIAHKRGCPKTKGRMETYTRRRLGPQGPVQYQVERCQDCGATESGKPKKVED